MSTTKKILKQEYDRLKRAVEKMMKPVKKDPQPQYLLQPIRDKKYF